MRTLITLAVLLMGLASCSNGLAAPLNVDVIILTGPGGSLTPSTHVPDGSTSSSTGDNPPTFGNFGSPLSHASTTHATATLIHPALSEPVSTAVGSAFFIESSGALSVFNRSILSGISTSSYRVQTSAAGEFTRTAVVSGQNDLTLNIVNSALELVDIDDGAFALIQTVVTVTTSNGVQSYTLNASLTNLASDPPLLSIDPGSVTTTGPNFGSLNGGTLFVAPTYAVTFHLGNLALGSVIDIDYTSTTVAFSPFNPDVSLPERFVRAQFGDQNIQGGTNLNPIVSAGAATEAPEASSLVLAGICAIVGIAISWRRQRAA